MGMNGYDDLRTANNQETRMTPKYLSMGLLVALLSLCSEASAATYSAYVMGYFKESPNGSSNSPRLHLAISKDGYEWLPLNQNNFVVQPAMGTKALRDPFFYRMPDGSFTIVATDNWNSEYIHIWSSPDLRTFTDERLVRMNTTGMHSWAPEVFWDEGRKQHAIIWSGNTDRNRIYVSYTTDFKTVTTPVVFFDPGFPVIDGHMEVGIDGYNYMYFKDERDWKLYGTRSTTLAARSFDANKFTTGHGAPFNGSHTEAPILIRRLDGKGWQLWGDSYNPINAVFYSWEADNLFTKTWTALGRRDYTAPPNAKHATIVPITSQEYDALLTKWGRPNFEIIKSRRIPTAFIRRSGSNAKVSNYPFDPVNDMYWKVVPGLADPSGVSFESVALPGNYLRQSNNIVALGANDNSAAFKSNATFYKAPGFSDATWSSFRSHAVPDRYLRQSADSTLRLDPITNASSATDKDDATFLPVYSRIMQSSTGVAEHASVHKPSSTISVLGIGPDGVFSFSIALGKEDRAVVDVVDLQGRRMATILDAHVSTGEHRLSWNASSAPNGIYAVRLVVDGREAMARQFVLNH
jgi:hypothetical protein